MYTSAFGGIVILCYQIFLITKYNRSYLAIDPKDDFLLNLCIDSKADYLITGDNDLLAIKEIESCTILAYSDFIRKIHQ